MKLRYEAVVTFIDGSIKNVEGDFEFSIGSDTHSKRTFVSMTELKRYILPYNFPFNFFDVTDVKIIDFILEM